MTNTWWTLFSIIAIVVLIFFLYQMNEKSKATQQNAVTQLSDVAKRLEEELERERLEDEYERTHPKVYYVPQPRPIIIIRRPPPPPPPPMP